MDSFARLPLNTRLTSARSPLGNPAGVTFGQRVSAHRCSVPLFWKSSGPQPPGPKPPVNRHDFKHTSHGERPPSQPFVFNRISPEGRTSVAAKT